MTEAPDVSDLELDIRFRGRSEHTWDFELVSPVVHAKFCAVPIWDTLGLWDEEPVALGYTEAYRAAENQFIYQVTAQDWLRDENGEAVTVGSALAKGRGICIDYETETWRLL